MRKYADQLMYAFPVQLFILHLKKNHFLILFWLFLISIVTNLFGARYGLSLLFLDPEYLGREGFSSFLIIGVAFGYFVVVWNLTSYILNANHFPFLATLQRPFGVYALNNSILPLLFFIIYIFRIVGFQAREGLLNYGSISYRIGGLLCGMFVFVMLSMVYFFRTNKSIFQVLGLNKPEVQETAEHLDPTALTHKQSGGRGGIRVVNYINHRLRVKLARSADHYPENIIRSVYRQHHANALFMEMLSLVLLILLGYLMDHPVFRIPAASSILVLFTILIMLLGAFSYWLGAWKIPFFVLLVVAVSLLMRMHILAYHNAIYGLDYSKTSPYTLDALARADAADSIAKDEANTLQILENWKNKFSPAQGKPKMVMINCSGGGLRATAFVMQVLQIADSITNGRLMFNCPLMTGASGGLIAAAYYRELYLRKAQGADINLHDSVYLEKISSDMLNPVAFAAVVNDLFYPWQSFTYDGMRYKKDRGYMFEKILNENTDSILEKPLAAYAQPEYTQQIPMMIFYPTVINDERKLFISTQHVSYLAIPSSRMKHFSKPEMDGVDVHSLLNNNYPDSMSFTSILRMNCTFPYILPNATLPTDPPVQMMDAGIRDNFGIETSTRFVEMFRDWILQNTSGVIVVNIRGLEQVKNIRPDLSGDVVEKLFSPVGNLYTNWVEIQDYQNDFLLNYLDDLLGGKLDVITFEYKPSGNNRQASLSFHLTNGEKKDIAAAAESMHSMEAYTHLQTLLK